MAFLDLLIKAAADGADLSDDDIREEVDLVMFAVSGSFYPPAWVITPTVIFFGFGSLGGNLG